MNEIIQTMMSQFGGRQSFLMIGGKIVSYSNKDYSLTFSFMRNGSKATKCTLQYKIGTDDYIMSFYTSRNNLIKEISGLFCDDLKSAFSNFTDLSLTVPKIIGVNC